MSDAKTSLILEYARRFSLNTFIETGTAAGGRILEVADHFEDIYSIELSAQMYALAKEAVRTLPNVHLIEGDSRTALGELLAGRLADKNIKILFWLDAHHSGGETAGLSEKSPLIDELYFIYNYCSAGFVLIDDQYLEDWTLEALQECYPGLKYIPPIVIMDVSRGQTNVSDLARYFQEQWEADEGEEKLLRTNDTLTNQSIVWDVGGYKGEWSAAIIEKYDPQIFIFEPIKAFQNELRARFSANPKVSVEPYGLGSRAMFMDIHKAGAASSFYQESAAKEKVELREVPDVAWRLCKVEHMKDVSIDLISINAEGAEYDILMSMSNSGLAYQCRDIQIQFHPLWPNSYDERKRLRNLLLQTHDEVYCYPFVWEMWRRR